MAHRERGIYNEWGQGNPPAPPAPSATREIDTMSIEARRLFLREPGWQVGHKMDTQREFCYMTAPGEDFYHRLSEGELYVFNGEERLCIRCAEHRGLLGHEPRLLRAPAAPIAIDAAEGISTFDLEPAHDPGV